MMRGQRGAPIEMGGCSSLRRSCSGQRRSRAQCRGAIRNHLQTSRIPNGTRRASRRKTRALALRPQALRPQALRPPRARPGQSRDPAPLHPHSRADRRSRRHRQAERRRATAPSATGAAPQRVQRIPWHRAEGQAAMAAGRRRQRLAANRRTQAARRTSGRRQRDDCASAPSPRSVREGGWRGSVCAGVSRSYAHFTPCHAASKCTRALPCVRALVRCCALPCRACRVPCSRGARAHALLYRLKTMLPHPYASCDGECSACAVRVPRLIAGA